MSKIRKKACSSLQVKYTLIGFISGLLLPVLVASFSALREESGTFSEGYHYILNQLPWFGRILVVLIGSWVGYSMATIIELRKKDQSLHGLEILAKNEELKENNQKLRELNEALDTLVYSTSHDLKTPVVNFQAMVSMLRKVYRQPGQEVLVGTILDKLDASAFRFMHTISDLLDVSRIEKQLESNQGKIDLRDLISEIEGDVSELIQEKKAIFHLDLEAAPTILFSKRDLHSILQNLISNGLKYARTDTPAILKVCSKIEGGKLFLSVSDNGQGIDLDQYGDKLFKMFSRLNENSDGSGVGLYLVRRIMNLAGGEVEVKSKISEGTAFTLIFPTNYIP